MDRAVAWVLVRQATLYSSPRYKTKGSRLVRDQIVFCKDLQTDYANLIMAIGPIASSWQLDQLPHTKTSLVKELLYSSR